MKFIDTAPIAGTRRTADGYLVAEVRTARTGIQLYAGHEVGIPAKDVVRVYRPADQVFSKDSLSSYAHKPVTNDHPGEAVSAENWRDYSVGQIGDEVARDGEFVRIPLVVMDAAAIKAVEDGKRELSAGYTCDLAFEVGTTPDGQAYDAIQKGIRINHVAIVNNGRAGSQARIGDGVKWGASPFIEDKPGLAPLTMSEKGDIMSDALKTVVLGDKAVQVAIADVAAIEQFKTDSAKALSDAKSAHDAAIAVKDAEIAKKDAEIDALKAKVFDAAALDAAVKARGDLIAKARVIAADVKTDGLSDAEIRKAVVVAKFGDSMKEKSGAYIDARFDVLAEDAAGSDQVRDALTNLKPVIGDAKAQADKAFTDGVADLNAWRYQKEA